MKDVIVDRATAATTYGGSGLAFGAGITANEMVAVAGLALGLASFGLNWFYRHKTFLHQKNMAEKTAGPSDGS